MEFGLSIGTNLGDRAANMRAVASSIAALPGVAVVAESPIYETDPVEVPAEFAHSPFLNGIVIVECDLSPAGFAGQLNALEARLGRVRGPDRNAPRTADIDIVYADRLLIDTPALTIPHPRWAVRRFVVQPLADLRPDLILPDETRTVAEILLSLPETPKVVRYSVI